MGCLFQHIRVLQQFFCRFTTKFQVNKAFIDFAWEHLAASFHSGCTTSSSSPGLVFDHWIWLSSNACWTNLSRQSCFFQVSIAWIWCYCKFFRVHSVRTDAWTDGHWLDISSKKQFQKARAIPTWCFQRLVFWQINQQALPTSLAEVRRAFQGWIEGHSSFSTCGLLQHTFGFASIEWQCEPLERTPAIPTIELLQALDAESKERNTSSSTNGNWSGRPCR